MTQIEKPPVITLILISAWSKIRILAKNSFLLQFFFKRKMKKHAMLNVYTIGPYSLSRQIICRT